MSTEALKRIRKALERDKVDNLERAQMAFRGHDLTEMYGQSERTKGEILAGYEADRADWQRAWDYFAALPSPEATP